ncbi:MAG TPA: cytochrome P450 [Herpetosiphonaceae bacterium]
MSAVSLPRPKRGALFDITRPEFKADPFPYLAEWRAKQPIVKVKAGMLEAWLVTRYDDVLSVLKDPRFSKELRKVQDAEGAPKFWMPEFVRVLEQNMLDQDDPNHARLRGLVHKAFTPRRIEQLQPRIEAIAGELLDAVRPHSSMDLVRDFALPLPLTVIAELLGVPLADRDRFHRWSGAVLQTPTAFNLAKAIPTLWTFIRYLRRQLAQRRAEPRDDLLTALVQAEEAGDRLSENEAVAMVILLLIAGHETTVNLIASGTLALLQQRDQWDLLRARPELMKSAIEELVRFANPVETATERYAGEDLELAGQQIKRGELVLAGLASANRDPAYFSRPDLLDITREKNRHLGFGMGIHFCLGAPLARMEAQIALGALQSRLPDLRLAVPAETLRWRATPIVRGLAALPVRW